MAGYGSIVQYLIDEGADPSIEDSHDVYFKCIGVHYIERHYGHIYQL